MEPVELWHTTGTELHIVAQGTPVLQDSMPRVAKFFATSCEFLATCDDILCHALQHRSSRWVGILIGTLPNTHRSKSATAAGSTAKTSTKAAADRQSAKKAKKAASNSTDKRPVVVGGDDPTLA